jgi:transcriptional regulator with XRE-family HTH domain
MRGRGRPPKTTGARRYPSRLRELREHRGLSQQSVAVASGMSDAYYGALERGDKRIHSDTAERLARALGCDAGELLGGAHGMSVPLVLAVAAAESKTWPGDYDRPQPYERIVLNRHVDPGNCIGAEIFDDSADMDFGPGTILILRRPAADVSAANPGAKVLVRFFLDPPGTAGEARRTHEILYGVLDRNIVGDLVLITRTRNRLIPRNALIQSAESGQAELAAHGMMLTSRDTPLVYERRPDDPAELLGVVVYAMGPVGGVGA